MLVTLVPCPSCARHVRAGEGACPFCGAAPSDLTVAPTPAATQQLRRAATFVFATSLALAGCASSAGTADSAPIDAADASAPSDTPTPGDTPTASDVPMDFGNVAPPYGLPPPVDQK